MKTRFCTTVSLLTALITLTAAPDADAYIDPGTGSYLLQLLAAAVLGAVFALKLYWAKAKAFFGKRLTKTGRTDEPD